MKLDQEVIMDLAPLYFAGEASAASCALVENYFAEHPELAATLRASQETPLALPASTAGASSHAPIQRLRRLLRLRAISQAVAIACVLAPLSFAFGPGYSWIMLRDEPVWAAAYLVLAVAAGAVYFRLGARIDTP